MATIKELSIEEKAKAYDELKVKAQELEEDGCFDKLTLFDLFPELAESEDEKIKEAIIATIHLYYGEPLEDEAKEMIAWVEKQGEKGTIVNEKEIPFSENKPAWSEWKPSEEHIKALEDSIKFLGCTNKVREDLKSLYWQLKKLKEA